MGGFECSTHINGAGQRLDMIAATQHDKWAGADYARAQAQSLHTVRDGIRWHVIERNPGVYDWGSVVPMVRAAQQAGIQVIWDLCHYGWPDDIDLFAPAFVTRFARMAGAFAHVLNGETDMVPFLAPVNEISFFSWAAGEVGYIFPHARDRGRELKAQLVRAAIGAMEAVLAVCPNARFVHPDPAIHVHAEPGNAEHTKAAHDYTLSMYEGWDMISGRLAPHLGGQPRYLDIVALNYYPHNQWVFCDLPFNPAFKLSRDDVRYRPFREILADIYARYERPILLAETGADGEDRVGWLRYVGREARAALRAGVGLEGICLYPVVNFPWWDDGHHLYNGLWDYADAQGNRPLYDPLARELALQQRAFARLRPLSCPVSF